jgi:protease-4
MISGIENIYDIFKERVIQGRELSPEAVENLAQGRVWSGKQALKLGLIDDLGDLQDAITLAANDLDIEDYNVIEYPKFEDNLENMLKGITPSLELRNPLKNLMPEQMMLILESNQSRGPSPYIQTLLPFELRIH